MSLCPQPDLISKFSTMSLVFVNIEEPKDALKLTKESEVRSHVARYQWRNPANRQAVRRRKKVQPAPLPTPPDSNNSHEGSTSEETDEVSVPPLVEGGLRVDPFRTYPITWRPFVPPLVDHCKYFKRRRVVKISENPGD